MIKNVTLACADSVNPEAAVNALRRSSRQLSFGRIVIFTHRPPANLSGAIEWVEIERLCSVDEYNEFILRDLYRYIKTSHVLMIQEDGFIIHPHLWQDSWLEFDYIGAPWPDLRQAQKSFVGNSGCSSRSIRLLKRLSELATPTAINNMIVGWRRILDDVFACYEMHDQLVREGFRFAPPEIAAKFSFERPTQWSKSSHQAMGFHGRHTEETRRLCDSLPGAGKRRHAYHNKNVHPIPESGLISPADHKIVQIEVTNACPLKCSNCTRLISHVRKPYMLSTNAFRTAVESLREHPGMIGVMGGEPTLHPDFETLSLILAAATHHEESLSTEGRQPIRDFGQYRQQELSSLHHRRGLWTSLGKGYYKHYGLIQEVYPYQCINTHEHGGKHQANLIAREDLDISDAEWEERRDKCWVQRLWSSSINPAGAYFCECAAAIDLLLFGGEHAWPVTPSWWKRNPEDFNDQLHLCELCSAPQPVARVEANAEIDIVSPSNIKRLKAIQAPSIAKGRVISSHKIEDSELSRPHAEWYLPENASTKADNAARIPAGHVSIRPKHLDGVIVCVDYGKILQQSIAANVKHFRKLVVVTTSDDQITQQVATDAGAFVVISDRCYDHGDPFNKGRMLNDGLAYLRPDDWVLFTDADILLFPSLAEWFSSHVLNPDCLYYTSRYHARSRQDFQRCLRHWPKIRRLLFRDETSDQKAWGYFQLWHSRSRFIRQRQPPVAEAFPNAGSVDNNFARQWPRDWQIRIDEDSINRSVVHVWHGHLSTNWENRGVLPGGWEMLGQMNEFTRNVWYRRPLQFPCELRLMDLTTTESVVIQAEDDSLIREWMDQGRDFDIYARKL
jgi:hypothetical protein